MDSDSDQKSAREAKKRAPTALTVECGVCAGPAPDHIHFGARCCYSCRAFFRRRAQRSEVARCRLSSGACDISVASKKCIACRYNKCLVIGMDPALVQGIRKKRSKRSSDAAEEDDEEEEEDDDSDSRMTPRLPKRERRESESVAQRSSYAANPFSPTASFPETSPRPGGGLTPERSKDTQRTDYGPPMSPRLTPTMPASSVFERKPFDFMSPHSSSGDIIPSFGCYSSASAKPPPGYPGQSRPVGEATSHLLHQTSGQQQVYSQGNKSVYSPGNKQVYPPGTGSQYTGSKFHYSGDGGSHQSQQFYSGPGQFLPPSKSPGHGASHRRPSVIMRAGKEDSNKLQMQADILKFHGNILTHTGNLFNYHANLLNSQKQNGGETKPRLEVKQETLDPVEFSSAVIKNETDAVKVKSENPPPKDEDYFDVDIADQVFEEAQDLLFNSPWILRESSPQQTSLDQSNQSSSESEKAKILDWLQSPDPQGQQTSVIQESYPQQNCQMF